MPMTDAAMLQKIRVSTNSPATEEPMMRAHRDFSPVRAFILTRIQELMVWPGQEGQQRGEHDLRDRAQRALQRGLLGGAEVVVEAGQRDDHPVAEGREDGQRETW